jgi:hypothetical protein
LIPDPKENPSEKFTRLKTKLSAYGMKFGKTVFREGALILRPVKQKQLFTGKKGITLWICMKLSGQTLAVC